ncbi:hypothetical protein TVAG_263710 [Trichomonas vaginalis G3]|uniref:Uncharacterized protein n=1 Tax=Trichomonas vaginalis (strain ATCC PRA-98 / G3) TaxID=412133 RepID=A2ENZ8_TRIV3|nr:hypothetical protein TVAGG3_0945440 [Trichomonas vaginalis G3]EAY05602.1 hypothetical protein TVAG_263710 [Trichomonas vaginalis G3]KAI5486842.1 hypothetical protein TVAGG3_0945440 [Trichomonas vaginalis G3]|eukprot:XP_001317825.1 hypothetical protein [Trichomonas vaginalis G3]
MGNTLEYSVFIIQDIENSPPKVIYEYNKCSFITNQQIQDYFSISKTIFESNSSSSNSMGEILHISIQEQTSIKILPFSIDQKYYALFYCTNMPQNAELALLDKVFEHNMIEFYKVTSILLKMEFNQSDFHKIVEHQFSIVQNLINNTNKHIKFPVITLANLNNFVKLLTFHLTNNLHTCVCQYNDLAFLSIWLEPSQRIRSSFEQLNYNSALYVQYLKKNDSKVSNYTNIKESPWVVDALTEISQSDSFLQEYMCIRKFFEALKITSALVAMISEILRNCGSDILNSQQIDEICSILGLKSPIDIKMFIGLARIYQDSSYYKFFKQNTAAIANIESL